MRVASEPIVAVPVARPEPPRTEVAPVTLMAPVPVPELEVLFTSKVPAVTKVPPV